jgi:hypothetical protein
VERKEEKEKKGLLLILLVKTTFSILCDIGKDVWCSYFLTLSWPLSALYRLYARNPQRVSNILQKIVRF